jgi:branched-chain amino acid transport system permease protein
MRTSQNKWVPWGFGISPVLVFLLLYPYLVNPEESYLISFLFSTFLFVALAQGWNLVAGFTGQASLGQHAFFGLGAYLTAMTWMAGWTGYLDPLAMVISGVGAALLAVIIGLPLLAKLRGDYFALGTLGLGEILRVVFTQGGTRTGGPVGLMLPSSAYQSMRPYYYLALLVAFLSVATVGLLIRSRFGLALVAVREDEQAAAANGIPVLFFKILAFALGSFFAGLCGSLYAFHLFHIHPGGVFNLNFALLPILMTILGGIGTVLGPLLGAFILNALFELANRYWPEIHPIISGAFIILVMLFLPQGLIKLREQTALWQDLPRGFSLVRAMFFKADKERR